MVDNKCGRCGKDPAEGFAFINDVRYCHGDYNEPTCYMLATNRYYNDPAYWFLQELPCVPF